MYVSLNSAKRTSCAKIDCKENKVRKILTSRKAKALKKIEQF